MDAGFGGLDGIKLIMGGACGAGKIINFVNFAVIGKSNIVANQLEIGVSNKVGNVVFLTGEKIVHADHIVAIGDKTVAEMTPKKTGSSCDKGSGSGRSLVIEGHGKLLFRYG